MRVRWAQGLSDAESTLLASPWLSPVAPDVGARTFDVLQELHAEGVPEPVESRNLNKNANR